MIQSEFYKGLALPSLKKAKTVWLHLGTTLSVSWSQFSQTDLAFLYQMGQKPNLVGVYPGFWTWWEDVSWADFDPTL